MNRRSFIYALSLFSMLPALAGGASEAAPAGQTPTPAPTKPILLTGPVPDPHQDGVVYFPQTGHTLRGLFLRYWKSFGGLAQFGYPITEEFFEPSGPDNTQLQVQYFERSHFEMHHDNSVTPNEVLMGLLGREFHAQDPPTAPLPAPAQYFPETGHNLSGAFLRYWQSHGGLYVHGYPISEPAMETSTDGKQYLTQWFERSRFELHPENAGTPYEVLLGQLGRQFAEKKGYPYGWYPAYGHAVDFTWVAGQLEMREPLVVEATGGCTILRYDQTQKDARVQLDGPGWAPFIAQVGPVPPPLVRDFLVIFGHQAHPGERYRGCNIDPAPGYILDKLQTNPAQ